MTGPGPILRLQRPGDRRRHPHRHPARPPARRRRRPRRQPAHQRRPGRHRPHPRPPAATTPRTRCLARRQRRGHLRDPTLDSYRDHDLRRRPGPVYPREGHHLRHCFVRPPHRPPHHPRPDASRQQPGRRPRWNRGPRLDPGRRQCADHATPAAIEPARAGPDDHHALITARSVAAGRAVESHLAADWVTSRPSGHPPRPSPPGCCHGCRPGHLPPDHGRSGRGCRAHPGRRRGHLRAGGGRTGAAVAAGHPDRGAAASTLPPRGDGNYRARADHYPNDPIPVFPRLVPGGCHGHAGPGSPAGRRRSASATPPDTAASSGGPAPGQWGVPWWSCRSP